MKDALGLIEIQGLATAILVADTMVKTASVTIIQIEKTRGHGWITVKITGDVGAVNAAVSAGKQIGETYHHYISSKVIPRPSDSVEAVFCQTTKQAEKPVSPVESSPIPVIEEEIPKQYEEISEEKTVETILEAENHSVLESEGPSEPAAEQNALAQEPITLPQEETIRSEPTMAQEEPAQNPIPPAEEKIILPEPTAEHKETTHPEPPVEIEKTVEQPVIPPVKEQITSKPEIKIPAVKTESDSKKKALDTAKTTPGGASSAVKNTTTKTTVVKEKNPSKPATRKPKGKKDK
nr:BMC domain-containing protein [uncultured Caproiciproducens sp.]